MMVGLVAIIVAWVVLLSGVTNPVLLPIEFGGVAICLVGYFMRKREKLAVAESSAQ